MEDKSECTCEDYNLPELQESIKEAGQIKCGEVEPSRAFFVGKEWHEPLCKTSRALPIGSVGCICEQIKHSREIDSALQERDRCYKYAVTLLKSLVPSCEPLTTLMGVLNQIDNWCSGQKNWATEKEVFLREFNELQQLREKK